MNTTQISQVGQIIDNINALGIDDFPKNIFKDQDVATIVIGGYLLPGYIVALKRMLKQFKAEVADNGTYLPFQYNFQNEYGNGNLQNDFQNLLNLLKQQSAAGLINSVSFLNRLIYYQIANGFWDRSKIKIHKADDINLSELNDKLNIIAQQLYNNQSNFGAQINNLNIEKKNLSDFIAQKKQELQQVANNLSTSNANTQQIQQLLNTSTATNGKIEALLTQQNHKFEEQKNKATAQDDYFSKQKGTFSILEVTLTEKVKTLENQIKEFDDKLKYVEDKKAFFEERNEYLTNLIGREVGVSLFETFKQRKTELEKPVNNWLRIVISMAALTFFAIITIFTNGFGLWGDILKEFTAIQLITNTIKTFPFFFLLFYSISQYNKERNFQEEYAFKSAVALTIKAYADIIKQENLKDTMIIDSVAAVYKSPTTERGRSKKESIGILDTAKDLLSTAVDVMQKK
jgi:hypothetical protein